MDSLVQEPVLMSAAWGEAHDGTAIARHEWKGLSKLRGRLEDWVDKEEDEAEDAFRTRSVRVTRSSVTSTGSRNMPGRFVDSNESEEESDSLAEVIEKLY